MGFAGALGRRYLGYRAATALFAASSALSVVSAQAQPQTSALTSSAQRVFTIPEGPLSAALVAFGRQAGVQISYVPSIASGLTTTGVSGSLTPNAALAQLLAGSGLSYRFSGARTVLIEKPGSGSAAGAAPAGAISLDTIDVQGNNQSPYGPGVGYVATRSVTSTKTDTPIIEMPQSISVVTRQQIDDQGAQSVDQALRYSSGVVSEMHGNQTLYDYGFLRGFGAGGGVELAEYQDGLRLLNGNFIYPQIEPYGLARIEVLKGPASVLYGQNDPGGIVNLSSKLPTDQPFHEVQLQTGNFGRLEGAFDFGGPVDKDGQVLYRLTGLGLTTDTQTQFVKQQRLFIAPAVTWKPDADTSLTILTSYQHDPSLGYLADVPARGTVLFNPNGRIPSQFFAGEPDFNNNQRTQESLGYRFEHRFDDAWTVRQNFRYMHSDLDEAYVYNTGFRPDLATLNQSSFVAHDRLNAIDLDNQVQTKFSTGPFEHTVLSGLDYQNNANAYQCGFGAAPALNVFNPVYNPGSIAVPPISISTKQQVAQIGAYSQDQVKFGNFRFLVGGREDWASTTTTNQIGQTSTFQNDQAFTWRTGLVYLFDNGLAPYVSYSTSFLPALGTDFAGDAFKPTTAQQYEVGVKYQPPGSNSFITMSLFDLTEQNVLTSDPNPSHIGFSVQTGAIRSQGVELEGKTSLSDSLDLIASFAYADVVNIQSSTTDTTIDGIVESTQGKHQIQVPATTGALWANYTFHSGVLSGFALGGGVRYVGFSYGDDVNSFKVPAVTLFDAALHYDLGQANSALKGFQVAVNVSNLFDKSYVASCTDSTTCFFGLRRTVFATLKYQW